MVAGRTTRKKGVIPLTPVRPSGIIRDECQLLADAAANLGARLTLSGNVVEVDFRFSTPSQGELLTVSMAGQFAYSEESFSADGTAANILLPIGGQACQLQLVDVHLDATTLTLDELLGGGPHHDVHPASGNLHLSGLVRVPGRSQHQSEPLSLNEKRSVAMADPTSPEITSVLTEGRVFPPPPEFSRRAHIKSMEQYRELAAQAERDPEGYWGARGKEEIYWKKPFQKVLEWKPPHREVVPRRDHQPLLQLPRPAPGDARGQDGAPLRGRAGRPAAAHATGELHAEVCQLANGLKSLGVKKGDRVGIYLPMIPEAAIAMLACARIGAVHSVVFGGFSAEALRERMNDAGREGGASPRTAAGARARWCR